eukprot:15430321-Alexandrium_andersonii.AAC.1
MTLADCLWPVDNAESAHAHVACLVSPAWTFALCVQPDAAWRVENSALPIAGHACATAGP